jgi:hypothetical protein
MGVGDADERLALTDDVDDPEGGGILPASLRGEAMGTPYWRARPRRVSPGWTVWVRRAGEAEGVGRMEGMEGRGGRGGEGVDIVVAVVGVGGGVGVMGTWAGSVAQEMRRSGSSESAIRVTR